MVWKKKQTHKEKQKHFDRSLSVPHGMCGDYHVVIAARVAALLCVPQEHVAQIIARAHAAAQMSSPEHPDVRVLRSAWEAALPFATDTCVQQTETASLYAIPEKALRVMTALRIVDRMPYETLAAVWRSYTQERIAQEVNMMCHKLYRLSQPQEHIAQSDFVAVMRLVDAQVSVQQLVYMREDSPTQAVTAWEFYDALRVSSQTIGTDAALANRESCNAQIPQVYRGLSGKNIQMLSRAESVRSTTEIEKKEEVVQNTHKDGGHDAMSAVAHDNSIMRKLMLFAGMITVTIVLVFVALLILAQFETDADAQMQTELQAQAQNNSGTHDDVLPQERSVQEIIGALEAHMHASVDDIAEIVIAPDPAMATLSTDLAQAADLLERM